FGGMRRDEREEGGLLGALAMMIVAPIAASLIQLAISRAREYEADASGARLSHAPLALASALQKIATTTGRFPLPAGPATAHLWIVNPLRGNRLASLFSTHPPIEDRIARLRALASSRGGASGTDAAGPRHGRAERGATRVPRDGSTAVRRAGRRAPGARSHRGVAAPRAGPARGGARGGRTARGARHLLDLRARAQHAGAAASRRDSEPGHEPGGARPGRGQAGHRHPRHPAREDPQQPRGERGEPARLGSLRSPHARRGAGARHREGGDMISGTSRRWLIVAALVGFVAGVVVSARAFNIFGGESESGTSTPAPSVALPDFADLAAHISPSVVNISTTQEVKNPFGGMGEGEEDPFHDFFGPFERFFGNPRRPFKAKSLGSGFVIDAAGYILTNNHVVENADEIVVKLNTGKEFKAKVVGRDPKTDIALIEIHGASDLIPVKLGDSDKLRVGQWV